MTGLLREYVFRIRASAVRFGFGTSMLYCAYYLLYLILVFSSSDMVLLPVITMITGLTKKE